MSFASRFKAGSDIAGDLLNTYDAARRKKDMETIGKEKETNWSLQPQTEAEFVKELLTGGGRRCMLVVQK